MSAPMQARLSNGNYNGEDPELEQYAEDEEEEEDKDLVQTLIEYGRLDIEFQNSSSTVSSFQKFIRVEWDPLVPEPPPNDVEMVEIKIPESCPSSPATLYVELDGTILLLKIVPLTQKASLEYEAKMYETHLEDCYGVEVHPYNGYYLSESYAMIVMQDHRNVLESFDQVSPHAKRRLYRHIEKIHQKGVYHHNLTIENIVWGVNEWPYIQNFSEATIHSCVGPACEELVQARTLLGLNQLP